MLRFKNLFTFAAVKQFNAYRFNYTYWHMMHAGIMRHTVICC